MQHFDDADLTLMLRATDFPGRTENELMKEENEKKI